MYKKLIFLTILPLALFASIPNWYLTQTIPKTNSYDIVGYGEGNSKDEAVLNALENISRQISVEINSTLKIEKSTIGGYKKGIDKSSSQKTSSSIADYKVVKSIYNDKYFVAVLYENIPFTDRFIKNIKLPKKDEKQNSYFKNTLLSKKFEKITNKKLNLKLIRKDNNWFLKHNNYMQKITNKNFALLFKNIQNKNISFISSATRDILKDGEPFDFTVRSKKDGYISIVSVYEDGTVSTLIKNIKVKKDKKRVVPSQDDPIELTAGLINPTKETYDLYIAIYSKKPLSLEQFATAHTELIEDEKYKNFDEFIEFLDTKTFCSIKLITKP